MRISDWSSDVCSSDLTSWISAKRQDHPLALALWSPPPEDTRWIVNEAQMGLPDAPFVFSGDTLYAGASFGSNGQILIDKQATIHVDHDVDLGLNRSEEHTSELQSLMRISYAVFCLKKKKKTTTTKYN